MTDTPNFDYYEPISDNQRDFHLSAADHKLLLGGYGSGKTYPAIHESLFHCLENPGHAYAMFRNTWDSVADNIEAETVALAMNAGVAKQHHKDKHNLTLINDCVIMFRPLTLKRKIMKGWNICGFMVDDPNVQRYADTLSFLFTRLRNKGVAKATRFITIFTANWEGRDWIWRTFMKDRLPGGNDRFAYWICPTSDNNTLPETFIPDLAAIHSKEWMDRYVYAKLDQQIGIIYHMLDRKIHHMSAEEARPRCTVKILAMDVGMVHKTAILKMGTDRRNIYIWGMKYEAGWKTSNLGLYLKAEKTKDVYNRMIIDPSSAKGEMVSGTSIRADLRKNYGIYTEPADNNVNGGIQTCQDLLLPAVGGPRIFIDFNTCRELVDEAEIYRWKEPPDQAFEEVGYIEMPVKVKDDAVDAFRYGVAHLKKYIRMNAPIGEAAIDLSVERRVARRQHLPFYKEHDGLDPGGSKVSVAGRHAKVWMVPDEKTGKLKRVPIRRPGRKAQRKLIGMG